VTHRTLQTDDRRTQHCSISATVSTLCSHSQCRISHTRSAQQAAGGGLMSVR